jgi:integrase
MSVDDPWDEDSDWSEDRSNRDSKLESITPENAVDWYLRHRRNELAESSLYTHRSSLSHFTEWTDITDIEDLNQLNGREIQKYLDWRVEEAPDSVDQLAPKSEKTQIDITRKFIEYCESIDAVPKGLHEKILPFRVKKADEVREELIEMSEIEKILEHLETYHYASRDHVIWILLAEFGPRVGALQSLDVKDFHPDKEALSLRYLPENGTSLKNDVRSERYVSLIRDDTVDILQSYLDSRRTEVSDEHDRRPLLTTRNGRIGSSTIRKIVYRWSCPNTRGEDCDHSDVMTQSDAWRCLNNACPHMVRRGVITHFLRRNVPINVVSDRCDVSPAVIKQHYDGRSDEERMAVRRRVMKDYLDDEGE